MSFQDDVKKQIQINSDAAAAKKAQAELLEAERVRKSIEQINSCAYSFYNSCVKKAAEGTRNLKMYVVQLETMYNGSRIGLITQEQEEEARESPYKQFFDRSISDYESSLRWAETFPKDFALNAANMIVKILHEKGLANAKTELYPVNKVVRHPPSFFHKTGWTEKTNEVVGYYIRIAATW